MTELHRTLDDIDHKSPAGGLRPGRSLARLILVPSALPVILSGLRIGWAIEWRTPIAAELCFGASPGRGGLGAHGFVLTGALPGALADRAQPATLESSIAGVFAVGDVRSGSVRRVGGAIGEDAAAVAQIHQCPAVATTGASI